MRRQPITHPEGRAVTQPHARAKLILVGVQQADGNDLQSAGIAVGADIVEGEPRRSRVERPKLRVGMAHALGEKANRPAGTKNRPATLETAYILPQVGPAPYVLAPMKRHHT